jgi:hypothetical protein
MMDPKYLLIVKVKNGLVIRDTPRPESEGGRPIRTVGVGTSLNALGIHNINGVDYARLVPQNPLRSEWVRVAEADHSIEYVDVIEFFEKTENEKLADAINNLADAIRSHQ